MATTKLLPGSFSQAKPTQPRQQPISSNFSNWNQLLNNLNEIGKGSKKLAKKIDEKKNIVYKYSSQDTNLININNHIKAKISSVEKRNKLGSILTDSAADDDDKKQRKRFILESMEKNDIERNLEFLRKKYKYYKFIQHQEIVEIEAARVQNLQYKNSYDGYLRSVGIPIFISVSLTGVVAGVSLLFISNIAAVPFWISLCEKMLDGNISKIIFETTINIMSLFGLFNATEILALRTMYKDMMVETGSVDFKSIDKASIKKLIEKIFSTTETSKDKTTEKTFAFFSYIKKCIKSRDIYSEKSKETLSSILSAKDILLGKIPTAADPQPSLKQQAKYCAP